MPICKRSEPYWNCPLSWPKPPLQLKQWCSSWPVSTSQNALVANQAKCSWWQKSPCLAANIPKASFARPTIKPPPLKTVYTLFVRYCFLKVLGELCADLMESAVFPATAILEQPFGRIDMTLLPTLHCRPLKLALNPEPQKKSTCFTIPIYKKRNSVILAAKRLTPSSFYPSSLLIKCLHPYIV